MRSHFYSTQQKSIGIEIFFRYVFLLSLRFTYTEKANEWEREREKKERTKFRRIQRVIFRSFSLRSVDNHGVCKIQRQQQCRQSEQMNILISFHMNFCLIHRLNCARTTTHCYINTQIHLILLHIFCFFVVFSFLIHSFRYIWMLSRRYVSSEFATRQISLDFKKMVFKHFLFLCFFFLSIYVRCHFQVSSRFCVIIIWQWSK